MPQLPRAHDILRHADHACGPADAPADRVLLDYEARFLRRRRLVGAGGLAFLVDLAATTSLEDGDCLRLEDGRLVRVEAAREPLLRITGDLPRLAWHIGNRHTPCRIEPDCLMIRRF